MRVFFEIMVCLSMFMMMVQNNHKDRFAYALCFIVSALILGAREIIPLFLA